MRIWSLHPRYLDPQGLVALWRETLLAQAVLRGATKGYTQHPQLQRFRAQPDPLSAVARYLRTVHEEAAARGYRFDAAKIAPHAEVTPLTVTEGQMSYEWQHLLHKLQTRSPALHAQWAQHGRPLPHPLFQLVPGPIAPWEKV